MSKRTIKIFAILLMILILILTSCNTSKEKDLSGNPPQSSKSNSNSPRTSPSTINKSKTSPQAISKTKTTSQAITKTKNNSKAISKTKTTSHAKNSKKTKHKPPKKNIIISRFKTKILDMNHNRVFNITKASKHINAFTLMPNSTFSFNKVVGKRDSEKGYKQAKIIVKGEREEAIGGGICQLSSTIYNAVFPLKLPIIERHNHTGDVHYLPQGKDAAVDYGSLDLKFKNTFDFPLRFYVYIKKGYLHVNVIKVAKYKEV